MSQQTINVGAAPNDGTGTPLRTAFQYTNANFTELYTALGGGAGLPGATTQVIFNDGGTNLAGDAGLTYNKTTDTLSMGAASITGDLTVGNGTNANVIFNGVTNVLNIGFGSLRGGSAYGDIRLWTDRFRIYNNAGTQIIKNISGTNGAETWYDGAGGTRMTLDSSGNLGLGVTPGAGGGVLQLKSGITFPATQVASSDANTLDDYEEGTWVGTLTGSSANPTTPVTATGRYTKVGRQVSVQIAFENIDTTGASGNITVTGLPFANSSVRCIGVAGSFLTATFAGTFITVIPASGSSFDFQSIVSNSAWSNSTHNAGSGRYIWANITYTVA